MFPHHNIHKYTWTSLDGTTRNQTDHTLTDRKWHSITDNVWVCWLWFWPLSGNSESKTETVSK